MYTLFGNDWPIDIGQLTIPLVCKDYSKVRAYLDGERNPHLSIDTKLSQSTIEQIKEGVREILPLDD